MSVYAIIAAEKAATGTVAKACSLLGVSRSAFYRRLKQTRSAHDLMDIELGKRISAISVESKGTYGAPRIHRQLRKEGTFCSRKRVARLMTKLGISGRLKRAFKTTTIADPKASIKMNDLVQRAFQPHLMELNTVWVGDITYLRTKEGWAFLATVIDLASRRVVGWAFANHMQTSLVSDAFKRALQGRRPKAGLIFHSDRGSQYTSAAFADLLAAHAVIQSFSRRGECWDNAVAESFFATLKRELTDRFTWPTRAILRRALFDFIESSYNHKRLHSTLNYTSPAEYERRIVNRINAAFAA